MSRYLLSFVVTALLYLPFIYLLFFYEPEKVEQEEEIPIEISSFIEEKKVPFTKEPPKPKPSKPLPKKLYPSSKKALEKVLPKVAKATKKTSKRALEERDTNATIPPAIANLLTIDEINSMFLEEDKLKETQRLEKEEQKLKDIYGEGYESLTNKEKEFLKENISTIGAITRKYLKFPYLAARLGMSGKNMVEFYLYPNGDISEVKLIDSSGYSLLDDNSIETIEIAHKDYPYPDEKTRVRIYVDYILN